MNGSPRWTIIFIALCVVVFIFQQMIDLGILAFWPAYAFEYPWMFVTSIFLHADISHLLLNMIALFFFGIYLEKMIGGRIFVLLFLISGIVGNIGYLLTASNSFIPAIGASGAIYGIIGALATLAPLMMVFIYGLIPVPMIVAAIIWVIIDFAGLFTISGIAHGAHIAGMVVGVVLGIAIRLSVRRRLQKRLY